MAWKGNHIHIDRQALQYLILEGWENEQQVFLDIIGNISEKQWSAWLNHWTNPLQVVLLLLTESERLIDESGHSGRL